ncbi:MAG: signal recognition particle-docking protein FtsY [Halobacteriales archaeon]
MFEGIKKTLGKFRSDVEEEAVEEVPEEDVSTEDAAEDVPAEEPAEDAPEGEIGEDAPIGGPSGDAAEPGAGDEATASSASDAGRTDTADAGATTEDEGSDTDESDATGGGTGIGRRAKSLVRGRVVIDLEDLEGPLQDLEMALLRNDVEMDAADTILDRVQEELVGETRKMTRGTTGVVEDALEEALLSVLTVGQFDFDARIADASKPVVIVFTGVNGVGKTTTIAKLSRYLEHRGYSSVLANGDTYRAGANEQIEEHADNLDRKCIAHEQGGDPAAVIYDAVEYAEANDIDVVLGDTAGRLHTDDDLMNQLAKINRVVGPDLTLFVDEAVAGQDAVNRAREFDEAATIDGAILTKADADSSGGAAISVAHVTGKPILFLGVGQGYEDLEPFDPEELVERLLES